MDNAVFYALGILPVIIGIIVIVVVIAIAFMGDSKRGTVKGAGLIMIGPIPVIFGTDKKSVKSILALALTLTTMVFIIFIVYYWLLR